MVGFYVFMYKYSQFPWLLVRGCFLTYILNWVRSLVTAFIRFMSCPEISYLGTKLQTWE
jgi:hypothetical protein